MLIFIEKCVKLDYKLPKGGNRVTQPVKYENELYLNPQITVALEHNFPLHQHRHIELICVTSGSIGVNINGRTTTLFEGDTAFFVPYVLHGYSVEEGQTPFLFKALFEPESLGAMGTLLLEYKPKSPIIKKETMYKLFPKLSEKLSGLCEGLGNVTEPGKYMKHFSELVSFVSEILNATPLEKSDKTDTSLFIRAVRICCEKYTEESFNVTALSKALGATPARLQQLFSKNLNLAVKEYITLLRMSKADSYLNDTDMNILDIAYHCGFGTVRSFNRAFMKTHGVTPSEFKKSHTGGKAIGTVRKVLSNFDLFYTTEKKPEFFFACQFDKKK